MATSALGDHRASREPSEPQATRPRAGLRSLSGVFVTPAFLAVVCAALFAWLHSLRLDSIERRSINRQIITQRLIEHVELVVASTVLVIAIAIPLGVLLTRPRLRAFAAPLLALSNIGQAVPSIGVLVLLAVTVGIGFEKAVIALVLYSVLPVLRNTMAGLRQVDRALIDAGRGMGLTRTAVLFRVELPLAVPVILAGIRVALIVNVGTATLAAFTNAGGLGTLIDVGIKLNRTPVLLTGSVLTAVLAMAIDWLAGLAERFLRPRGL